MDGINRTVYGRNEQDSLWTEWTGQFMDGMNRSVYGWNEQDSLRTEWIGQSMDAIGSQSHVLSGTYVQVMTKPTINLSHYWYPYRESERSSFRISIRSVNGLCRCGLWDALPVPSTGIRVLMGILVCRSEEGTWQTDRQNCVMAALFVLVVRCYQSDIKKEDGKDEECSTHGKDGESNAAQWERWGK